MSKVVSRMIHLNAVSRMKCGKWLLRDVSWDIQPGERWLLYGENGAGKTTLLNILNAYEPVTTDDIKLFGMRPGHMGYSAQHIGFVSGSLMARFQEGERVIDVVLSGFFKTIGRYHDVDATQIERATQQLAYMNMLSHRDDYFGQLSTGEQQRVMIARALVHEPDLLILDEPASGLDFLTRETLLRTLEQLHRDYPHMAMIYVTHFIEKMTQDTDHVCVLKQGEIFVQGVPATVVTSQTMSALFDHPVTVTQQYGRYALHLAE